MYVKEDVILPQNITFYDLIVNKAMGKSGPLFQFDLHEHAVASFDPRVKSQDSHAGVGGATVDGGPRGFAALRSGRDCELRGPWAATGHAC